MAAAISPELMDQTRQSVAQMSADELQRLQVLCGEDQEELTAFALAFLSERSPDAAGVALYAHVVLMEAFRHSNARFRTIEEDEILRAWEDNAEFVDALQEAGYGRQPFRVQPEKHAEPAALQYALDALTEDDEDDPVDIDDDEFWHAFRVLKTVIDCMHDARRTG
ncbi:MAG TPA: hypothetical protein VHP37_07740 [Burkholderiales bacterium]|nr:hypothetical protein [Burkholderiales bacterium]